MSQYSQVSGVMSKKMIKSGDRVVLFFIKRSQVSNYYLNKGSKTLISNEGSEVLYNPVALHIRGRFDECNFLVDIEDSENVKDIEKKIGASITKIISRIGDDREKVSKDKLTEKLLANLSICLEHESIFDTLVSLDKEKRDYSESYAYLESIKMLGFKVVKKVKSKYIYKLTNKDLKDIVIFSDGFCSMKVEKNGKEIPNIYSLGDLIETLELDMGKFKNETSTSLSIKNAATKERKIIRPEKCSETDAAMKKITEIYRSGEDITSKNTTERISEICLEIENLKKKSNIGHFTKEENEINERNINEVDQYANICKHLNTKSVFDLDRNSLEDLMHFIYSMWATNSVFMPTYSGYNDTLENYEKELYEAIGKLF